MMIRWVINFVIVLGVLAPVAMAQTEEEFMRDLEKIRNPFLSYLLKKIEAPPPQAIVETPAPPKLTMPSLPPPVVKPVIALPAIVSKIDDSFLQNLKLSGVIWDTDMPQAIVSDKVVKVGDLINGDKVVFIDKKGVEIKHNGLKYLLTVSGNKEITSKDKP